MNELWSKLKTKTYQLAHFQKRSKLKRYLFPIILIIIIFLGKYYLNPILGTNSVFLLVSFIVAASAWYGGIGPGLLATLISAIIIYFVYLDKDNYSHPFIGDLLILVVFILEGIIITLFSEARYEMENQKDEFIGYVSHELKNPLAAIKGYSELITRKNNSKSKTNAYGKAISIQSDKILNLINDLLDVNKIEIGKFTYKNECFNIDELVDEVITHQRVITPNSTIKLIGKTNKVICGDSYRIKQVIINLLTNAIKYSPKDKKIIVRLKYQKSRIIVSVKDFGIGISKSEKSHIFDQYYRTKNVQDKRSDGLGLGLFITSQIVKYHKGKIWVDSKLGKGSTFYLSLPLTNRYK